jgi:hypothetical protein
VSEASAEVFVQGVGWETTSPLPLDDRDPAVALVVIIHQLLRASIIARKSSIGSTG